MPLHVTQVFTKFHQFPFTFFKGKREPHFVLSVLTSVIKLIFVPDTCPGAGEVGIKGEGKGLPGLSSAATVKMNVPTRGRVWPRREA